MNLTQRAVLFIGVGLLIACALLPPWKYVFHHPGVKHEWSRELKDFDNFIETTAERSAGYHFIATPPEPGDSPALGKMFGVPERHSQLQFFTTRIDSARLNLEIIGAILLTVGICLAVKPRAF